MKKLFSLTLMLLLVLNVISLSAFATENEENPPEIIPKPTFIAQPQDVITPVDKTVIFSFEAENYTEIKWYMVNDGVVTDLSLNSRLEHFKININENVLEVKVGHWGNGTKFFAEIINRKDGMIETQKSDEATLIFDWVPIIDIQSRITHQRLDKRVIGISVKAHNYDYMRWKIDDKGQILTLEEAGDKYGFEAMQMSCMCIYPDGDFSLSLGNISEEMNGLKFIAVFYGFDKKSITEANALTLNFGKLPDLPVSEQPVQSETSSTSSIITENPEEITDDEPLEEVHTHCFEDEYKSNETHHWKLCECGEKSKLAKHTFKKDVCRKCNFTLKKERSFKPYIIILTSIGAITVVAISYLLIAHKKKIFPFKQKDCIDNI